MSQNTSPAVMAQRVEPHDSLDDFPTMPWATRALCEHVLGLGRLQGQTVWEPTCNRGHMVEPLREYFAVVLATDVHDYGYSRQTAKLDFLFPMPMSWMDDVDWIICNPPFRLAEEFVHRALTLRPRRGVCVFARLQFIEGVQRYRQLYSRYRCMTFAPFAERVPLVKGRLDRGASTATAYAWFCWTSGAEKIFAADGFNGIHIPPCRATLERDEDYAPLIDAGG